MRRGVMLLGFLMVCGCGDDIDRLGRIFEKTAAKFGGATESLRDRLRNGCGAVNGAINETSLDSRVALRLHWDKDLEGVEVQVHLTGPNVVELTGLVADLRQQRRAVELAQSTSGVDRVLDRLTLESDTENP